MEQDMTKLCLFMKQVVLSTLGSDILGGRCGSSIPDQFWHHHSLCVDQSEVTTYRVRNLSSKHAHGSVQICGISGPHAMSAQTLNCCEWLD